MMEFDPGMQISIEVLLDPVGQTRYRNAPQKWKLWAIYRFLLYVPKWCRQQLSNDSNVPIFATAFHLYCIRKAAGILYHVEHIVLWTLLNLLMNIFQRFVIEFSLFRLNF